MARTFSAATDNIDYGSPAALDDLSTLTILAWIYNTTDTGNQIIATKGWTPASAGMLFQVENSGAFRFLRGGSTFSDYQTSNSRVAQNAWSFIAVAASAFATASGVDLFYGSQSAAAIEEASYATSADGAGSYGSDAAANFIIGSDATNFFRGRIALVRVFNVKLTEAQIQREQFSPTARAAGCVLDCEFHTAIADRSNSALAATITGTAVSDHPPLWGASRSVRRPFVVPLSSQDVAVTNTAIFFSPYNTYSNGGGALGSNNVKGSSTLARWSTTGAYMDFIVTVASSSPGNVSLVLDTNSLSGLTANECPILTYSYDDRPHSTTQPAFSASPVVVSLATGLAAGSYTFRVWHKAIGLNTPGDQWTTPAQAVNITSVRIDASASLSAVTRPTKKLIWFGDSLGSGAGVIAAADPNGDVNATDNDALQAIPSILARALDADLGNISYGGCGWNVKGIDNQTPSSSNPALYSSTDANQFWNKYASGASRLFTGAFSPVPDYIVIMLGANDGGTLSSTNVTAAIDAIRTAAGTSCWIFVVPDPITGNQSSTIQTGVGNAAQQSRTVFLELTILYTPGTANRFSSDAGLGGGHYNVRGGAAFAAELVKLIQQEIGGGSGGYSVARIVNAA